MKSRILKSEGGWVDEVRTCLMIVEYGKVKIQGLTPRLVQITTENPGGSGPRPVRASSAGIGSGDKAAMAAPRDHAIKLACASGR